MIRVLLVDDHQLLRDSLRSLLDAQEDIEVVATAGDGAEALTEAAALRPDVVLMDLAMPRMGGVEATRRLLAAQPGTQVVVLTSFPDQELIFDSVQAGAVGYLLKDAAPEKVVAAVRSAAAGGIPAGRSGGAHAADARPVDRRVDADRPRARSAPARRPRARQQADRPASRDRRAHREGASHQRLSANRRHRPHAGRAVGGPARSRSSPAAGNRVPGDPRGTRRS